MIKCTLQGIPAARPGSLNPAAKAFALPQNAQSFSLAAHYKVMASIAFVLCRSLHVIMMASSREEFLYMAGASRAMTWSEADVCATICCQLLTS